MYKGDSSEDETIHNSNYTKWFNNLVLFIFICPMVFLKIIKYYVINVAIKVLYEKGEILLIILFLIEMFIDFGINSPFKRVKYV